MPSPVTVPPLPRHLGRDTAARARARAALCRVLWDESGERRLPSARQLIPAIEALHDGDLWWVCEASSAGPLYLLPTREWIAALVALLAAHEVKRVLEVGAGDGFLARWLAAAAPRVEIIATDDQSWAAPKGRMSAADRAEFAGVPFAGIRPGQGVLRLGAARAVARYRPDLVLACWPPPGRMVEQVIRAPSRLVLEIGVEGDVCGDPARTWRYEKDFLDGPLEKRALCRLDPRPRTARATRVTLYYGRLDPRFHEETR